MRSGAGTVSAQWNASLLVVLLLFGACRSWSPSSTPTVTFDAVPAADAGGAEKLVTIEGRATGVRPGQQVVLYVKSQELWWVQPFTDHPFTKIQADSSWKNQTHMGSEYAALLVEPGYIPSDTTETLPALGAGVVAVAVNKGVGAAPAQIRPKTIHFSGYDWTVRTAASFRGGSGNSFDPANVWTDESGALHLRIAKANRPGDWTAAELKLTRSLGYGTYVFVVRDISHLEPSAVLSFFTWDELGTEQNRRELDIEISGWGQREDRNTHYVVQPYYIPSNVVQFRTPAGKMTQSFSWQPGQVTFSTNAGSRRTDQTGIVNTHVFTTGVPSAGGDTVHMNLYVFGKGEIALKNQMEVVVERFEYLP